MQISYHTLIHNDLLEKTLQQQHTQWKGFGKGKIYADKGVVSQRPSFQKLSSITKNTRYKTTIMENKWKYIVKIKITK